MLIKGYKVSLKFFKKVCLMYIECIPEIYTHLAQSILAVHFTTTYGGNSNSEALQNLHNPNVYKRIAVTRSQILKLWVFLRRNNHF